MCPPTPEAAPPQHLGDPLQVLIPALTHSSLGEPGMWEWPAESRRIQGHLNPEVLWSRTLATPVVAQHQAAAGKLNFQSTC
jgi:hypothetical protein